MRRGAIIAGLLLALALLGSAKHKKSKSANEPLRWPDQYVNTRFGDFVLSNLVIVRDLLTPWLCGVVTNKTDHSWSAVAFELRIVTGDGSILEPAPRIDFPRELRPGQSFTFGPLSGQFDTLGMDLGSVPSGIASAGIILDASYSQFEVNYVFSLIAPVQRDELTVQDGSFGFVFVPEQKGIAFSITNNTGTIASLDWNGTVIVDASGNSQQVIHQGIKYADAAASKPPSVIVPHSRLEDEAIPVSNLHYNERYGWSLFSMFPNGDDGLKMAGTTFGLLLPIDVGGKRLNYFFRFQVKSAF